MRPKYQNIQRRKSKFQSPFGFGRVIPYRKIIKVIILFLLMTLSIYYLVGKSNLDIKKFTPLGKNINILLVGINQYNEEQLSILAITSINFKQQKYGILSIPLGTKVFTKYEELGERTLSQIYKGGGIKLTITSLENLLSERIPYYIIASRENAQKIVDLLNGIEILIPKQISFKDESTNIEVNIPSGWQKLDGIKASQYAYLSCKKEERNEVIERQQKYIEALTHKLFFQNSPLFFSEPMVQNLKDNVYTNLTLKDINHFISQLKDFNYKELKLATLIGKSDSSGRYFIPDLEKNKGFLSKFLEMEEAGNQEFEKDKEKSEKKLEKKIKTLVKDESVEGISKNIKIRILNGCGRKKIAHNLRRKLEDSGILEVTEVGNADSFNYKNTIIYDHTGNMSNANYVKDKFLKQGVIKQYIDKTLLTDITIIIGRDFKN